MDHPLFLLERLTVAALHLPIRQTWQGAALLPTEQVDVWLRAWGQDVCLEVDAPFHGDPAPAAPVGPCPGLWEHEVVELMLLGDDERYLEVELSPHGHQLVLLLEGRRCVVQQGLPLDFEVEASDSGKRWSGRARLPAAWVPPACDRVNAYAIHGVGEARRYLAFRPVGGERPDFHRLERFARLDEL